MNIHTFKAIKFNNISLSIIDVMIYQNYRVIQMTTSLLIGFATEYLVGPVQKGVWENEVTGTVLGKVMQKPTTVGNSQSVDIHLHDKKSIGETLQ